MNQATDTSALDALLDATLDDIADLPEFKAFNNGAHRALLSLNIKSINDAACIEASFKLQETLELADPADTPDAPGAESNMLFQLDNEFAMGRFKNLAKPIGEHLSNNALRAIIDQTKNLEVMIVTKKRSGKKGTANADKEYLDVVELQVC